MGVANQAVGPSDLGKLPDKELIEYFCSNRGDKAAETELWRRHEKTIRDVLRKCILGVNSLCPPSYDRQSFLDSCFSRAWLTLPSRICNFLETSLKLKTWLTIFARSTALDERRSLTRSRSKAKEVGFPEAFPEALKKDSEEVPSEPVEQMRIVEESIRQPEDYERSAGYFKFRSRYTGFREPVASQERKIMEEERKFIARKALVIHAEASEEDADSARAIRLWCWREWNRTKIAAYLFGEPVSERDTNTKLKAVSRDMDSDFGKLRQLLATQFAIRSFREI